MRANWVIIAAACLACTISIAACTATIVESWRLERTLDQMQKARVRR